MLFMLMLASGIVAAPPRRVGPAVHPVAAHADWLHSYAATPEGGFRVGSPTARIKLIEYGSLTCPHCRDFRVEAIAELYPLYIAPGKLSLEFRPFVLNAPDFVASMLVRCANDPAVSFKRIETFYDAQDRWAMPFFGTDDAAQARLDAAPPHQKVLMVGLNGRLDRFMAAHGMPRARFVRCLTDKPANDRLEALQEQAARHGISSTPTFFINGARFDGPPTWAALRPKLDQALR